MMSYSESDTRAKFIDPQIQAAGRQESQIVRERFFTDGRKLPGNKRGKQCFADYLLKDNGLNLAIIEAKKWGLPPTEWLEQVKEYGRKLHIRWVYSSNGQEIYEFDMDQGIGRMIANYPTPAELFERYIDNNATLKQQLFAIPYYLDSSKKPRYYQDLAVTKTLNALVEGQPRILLTLATGTGKTFIAFQIAFKLFTAKRSRDGFNRRPRILFLADRNILIEQAMNTFNPLEKDLLWITGKEIKKRHGVVPTNANIFFAIYQAIISGSDNDGEDTDEDNTEDQVSGYFRGYDPNFFDLIIIDECHRGWANEQWNWHELLQYFSSAVQLGMTATPKRDDNVNTYRYFWNPVYEYSLKEWINDGFLTPYKVKRIQTNMDELVIDSEVQIVRGEAEKDLYELGDFDRNIIVPERTELMCQEILRQINTRDKTIIFCVDQEHALRVRDMINANKSVKDADYCVRVTSNEWEIWRTYLERFQDNDKTIPTILTSSQMLTTWVDAKNVRNIVILRSIGSMTEFKQIIGRGTRVFEGKDFFTIIDFTGATNLFYDDWWDGPPEEIVNITANWEVDLWEQEDETPPKSKPETEWPELPPPPPREKLTVKLSNNRELRIINIETRYIDDTWKPVWATDYLESLIGKLPALYTSEEQLRTLWSDPESREQLLWKLHDIGIDQDQLSTLQHMFQAEASDIFDILAHLSFATQMKSRKERVQRVHQHDHLMIQQHLEAKAFLDFVLDYYAQRGSTELVRSKIGEVIKLYGKWSLLDLTQAFGDSEKLLQAWKTVQKELFSI